ncbi:MAG: DUF4384 domain-containing protein [Blastocatellia bacterium]|nr:DUF4384 domain-containing protein [Blastocatellia bacterium]
MKPITRMRKRVFLSLTAGLLAVSLMAVGSAAQNKKYTDDDERTRGLFVNKGADAMRVIILKAEEEGLVPVDPSHPFKEGDQIKVAFESNFNGYIYLVNITPEGKKTVLFPYADGSNNQVRANRRYEFPPGGDMIEFDNEQGTEVLQVIMSRERIALLDEAIKKSAGNLGESAASAAAELQAGISIEPASKVLPDKGESAVRSRDIKFAAGRDKDPEGSVVAISGDGNGSGKLKKGEAGVYEIRLKHN